MLLLLLLLLLEQQTGGASPGWPPPGRSCAGPPTHLSQSTRRPRALLVIGRALWRGGLLVQQAGELCMQVQIIEPREQRERQAATAAANRARPRPRTRGTPADLRLRSTDPLAVQRPRCNCLKGTAPRTTQELDRRLRRLGVGCSSQWCAEWGAHTIEAAAQRTLERGVTESGDVCGAGAKATLMAAWLCA
jgi:hypothetical protein